MDYILFEGNGVRYLVIEDPYLGECWTLTVFRYSYSFRDSRPQFRELTDTRCKRISDVEVIAMLEKYDNGSVRSHGLHELIERIKTLPF